ncbi:MAG: PEP-CTERM/exosortase system-associated acyltransferase [Gammaproteobacteria bacterium]
MDATRIIDDFLRYFAVVPADSEALRREAYRIRFQVYAEELGWEDRSRFPDGCEIDEHDADAVACLLRHRPSSQFAGCVRLVMRSADPDAAFPFEQAMAHGGHPLVTADLASDWRAHCGEISRIAVVSQFRRRRNERERPDTDLEDNGTAHPERRVFPHIAMGLYLGAAALGLRRGLDSVFAIMEPKLARRLRLYGIEFETAGEPFEHRGTRVPYRLRRDTFLGGITPPIRGLLDVIEADLDGQRRAGEDAPAA